MRVGVTEEHLVTVAQHVHIWFSILGIGKAMFGALAMAKEIVVASLALHWQGVALVATECLLLGAAVHCGKFLLLYVAQAILGVDKMVA